MNCTYFQPTKAKASAPEARLPKLDRGDGEKPPREAKLRPAGAKALLRARGDAQAATGGAEAERAASDSRRVVPGGPFVDQALAGLHVQHRLVGDLDINFSGR